MRSFLNDPLLRALLFDLDGTLVDSEKLKGRALAEACHALGGTVAPSAYAEVMGEDWDTVCAHLCARSGLAVSREDLTVEFRPRYRRLLETEAAPMPGAAVFLEWARDQGLRLGLVSSAAPWMVEATLARVGLAGSFECAITQEQVTRHKPDPEAYLLALQRLTMEPEEALVFEDSEAGLRAAASAGCRCVAVRHAFNGRHDLSRSIAVIGSFEECLA